MTPAHTQSPRASTEQVSRNPRRRALLRSVARRLNPLMLKVAGKRHFPLFALLHHRGRRSGRAYTTPVSALPIADGFIISLTFGEGSDWISNVLAEGGCTLRWNGTDYHLTQPEIVDWATARSAYNPFERAFVALMGIERFVRLRHAPQGKQEIQP